MRIVILDGSAANPGDIDWKPLEALGEVVAYDTTDQADVVARTKGFECAITNKRIFGREELEQLPDLKYIGVLATGYNVVDLDCCRERGIAVTNVPEYSTFATAQMTIAHMLELANKVGLHNRAVHSGEWVTSEQFCFFKEPIVELWNKNLHIVGLGKIGKRVAAIAGALGMSVTATVHRDPGTDVIDCHGVPVRVVPLEEGFRNADIISLHCPLTDETAGIINESAIDMMKQSAMIINCARGPLVDEAAVASALRSGRIAGYAADVVRVEPMLPDNPLLGCPNCSLTPHIAWAPVETRIRLISMAADNLKSFMEGGELNRIV
ncbi:glycerate dehydrogenase [Ruminococcaceae bacterium YRB3002]|nr:glycerate dehydrogenase [Ruminococcaceae bacterium YRB3002]